MVALATTRMHQAALRSTARLADYAYELYRPGDLMVRPAKVIRVLSEAGVRFVLMGALGLAGWRKQTRTTKDVDVLVMKRDIAKAVRALRAAFPKLEVVDGVVVTRFLNPKTKEPMIDVMKPVQKVFQMVLRYSIPVGDTHRVPDLEMALVSKFAAMVSPHREQVRKLQDGVDFITIVQRNLDDIDIKKLKRLAEQTYSGGGAEIAQLVEDIRAGRPIQF